MDIGVLVVNNRPWVTADTIVSLGTRAEALGFDSLWVADQVVVPSRLEPSYPYGTTRHYDIEGNQNFFEALTVLTYLAGRTSRVQLGTSVLVAPYRQPLLVAKQWATLDALSGGRTILGVGAGFMREQFEALGVDTFDRRGAATDEAIRLFRAAWAPGAEVSFAGEVYRFPPLRFLPKPARPGGPPIWVGGNGRRSIRRAAELGTGGTRSGSAWTSCGPASPRCTSCWTAMAGGRPTSSSRRNSGCTPRGPAREASPTSRS